MNDATIQVDPLTHAWNQLAATLERAPNVTNLPRDEVIRLCRCFFYVGAATAIVPVMEGWMTIESGEDIKVLHDVTFSIGEAVTNHPKDSIHQLLATMEAHSR